MTATKSLRLVIAAGGTGGHISPVLATLSALRMRGVVEATWIGGTWGIERAKAAEAEVPFVAIQSGKLRRYFSWQTPVDLARIPFGVAQSWRILGRLQPDLVFSTGGYVAVPTALAASWHRIPVLTHEQTAQLGLATRLICRTADVLALSFPVIPTGAKVGAAQVIHTGNPVRPEVFGGDAARGAAFFGLSSDLPTIYVTGGARGATPVNVRIEAALPALLPHMQIIHATGPADANDDCAKLRRVRDALPENLRTRYVVVETVGAELRDVYALATLVVGRSGAGTVAELAALGKPSLLIPIPNTGGDEATKNARVFADAGAALLRVQADVTGETLTTDILTLVRDPAKLRRMQDAALTLAPTDAASALADALLALADTAR